MARPRRPVRNPAARSWCAEVRRFLRLINADEVLGTQRWLREKCIGVVFDPIDRNYFWFNPGSLTDFERFCRPEFISPARPFAQNNRSWSLRPSSDGRCGKRSVGFDQT